MEYIQPFSMNEYYLWRKSIGARVPWKRQYTHEEFLRYEKERISKLAEWHKKFLKIEENKNLDEASFYTIPLELSSSWKGSIALLGNFNFVGLSALQNSPQVIVLALIPSELKQPMDYKLINITKSKKIYVVNERMINERVTPVEPAIIIEEWDYLPSDTIYVDIPYEKKIIQNILKENLIHDDNVSLSFQSPILSAPFVSGSFGGISLSSMAGSSAFAKELIKTIQLMAPPEYRGFNPPKEAYIGNNIQHIPGIVFRVAERPYFDNNFLSSVYDTSYGGLYAELSNRRRFSGEYSIFSTINPISGDVTQVWKDLMKNFTSTEVTLPENIDTLPEADVDLTRLRRNINEDLWIQVVHSRQIKPSFNEDTDKHLIRFVDVVRSDFDALLSDVHKSSESRAYLIQSMLYPTQYNMKRLAQSFARSNDRSWLSIDDLKQARNLIVDNFSGFISHPDFRKIKASMEKKREDARYSIVQTEIMNNPKLSAKEVYEAVKSSGLFRDIYDLQKLLDWLHEKGFVVVDINRRYLWIGKNV